MRRWTIYLILLGACWIILLRPSLHLYRESGHYKLGVAINNVFATFGEANIYTLPAALIFKLRSRHLVVGEAGHIHSLNWVFMLPYLLHCIHSYVSSVQHVFSLIADQSVVAAENYGPIYMKIIMMFGMQLLSALEIAYVLFYGVPQQEEQVVE
ncbi:uncharacterized protein LOC115622371 [Scaptodrosophila lebanonensis]|uniref:Uncharacterized protein LOC115622371 n=1 Tax=Drosophila lebanonensis TaxID=7225 RepID=A0A6J2TAM0_DROLE|nr:uncharacterized protein LOC115622371 [Scaptodrosophila lebanonensis]